MVGLQREGPAAWKQARALTREELAGELEGGLGHETETPRETGGGRATAASLCSLGATEVGTLMAERLCKPRVPRPLGRPAVHDRLTHVPSARSCTGSG